MARPVVHWEIGAQDAVRLRRFYAALFDWEFTGDLARPRLHKEKLEFEYVKQSQRSYK